MEADRHPWGWTDERRARQSALIHQWRPWISAQGPTSAAGKAASPRNRAVPGTLKHELLMMKRELADALRLAKAVNARRRSRRP
jgi:hypothetical protein